MMNLMTSSHWKDKCETGAGNVIPLKPEVLKVHLDYSRVKQVTGELDTLEYYVSILGGYEDENSTS